MDFERVEVPNTPCPLSAVQAAQLRVSLDPMDQCEDLGVSLYLMHMPIFILVFMNNNNFAL